jgi:iron complex transport system substrate-binding protein
MPSERGSSGPSRPGAASAIALGAIAAALAGWSPPPRASSPEPQAPPAEARTVTDAVGRSVELRGVPARIVSLAPNVTEMLYALGLGTSVVGVTDFCRVPEGAGPPSRLGGLVDPDLERIVALRPDLAVATTAGNYLEDAERLTRLGVPVYTVDTPDVEAILKALTEIGGIAGAAREAEEAVSRLRGRLDAVSRRVAGRPRPRVLFVVWGDPILAPGRGAFLNDALEKAGADSVSAAASARWTEYDLEQVLAARPEVILTVPANRAFAEALPERLEWAAVPAVRDRRVHVVGDAIQQPGPGIVDGIEEVAGLLHPAPAGASGP